MKLELFNVDPNLPSSAMTFKHWICTFNNLINLLLTDALLNKLDVAMNYDVPDVYDYIVECNNYEDAVKLMSCMSNQNMRYLPFTFSLLANNNKGKH